MLLRFRVTAVAVETQVHSVCVVELHVTVNYIIILSWLYINYQLDALIIIYS